MISTDSFSVRQELSGSWLSCFRPTAIRQQRLAFIARCDGAGRYTEQQRQNAKGPSRNNYRSPNTNVKFTFATLFALSLLVGGCASNPATGGADFVTMSEEKEIELGQSMHPQVMSQHRAYPNADLQNYVNEIGQKLVKHSDRPNIDYLFTVIDGDEVNAFAIPGGFIYVSRGLLAYLNSEAELAAVLGHEIGHVTARHAVRQDSRGKVLNVLGGIAGAAAGAAGASAANYVGGAYMLGYNRRYELEADEEGAQYMVRAGYDSDAILDVIGLLKNQELYELDRAKEEDREAKVYHGLFATHPDHDTRLREVVKAAGKLDVGTREFVENRERYLEKIDGLVYGKVGAGGVISENEFRHARFGIGLQFPDKWSINENRGRLESQSPDRQSVIILTRQPLAQPLSPLDIMTSKIGLKGLQQGRSLTSGNVNGYTAMAPESNSPYGRRPVRYGVFTDDKYAYVLAGANSSDRVARRDDWRVLNTIKSFRVLDDKGQRSAELPTIKVIEANSAMTMSTLGKASPLTDDAERNLRLLNNLYPDGEPKPGQKIKIID